MKYKSHLTPPDKIEATAIGIEVPEWIHEDITLHTIIQIAAIGCTEDTYPPIDSPTQCLETMEECGDQVLQYLMDCPHTPSVLPATLNNTWSGIAAMLLAEAITGWCRVYVYEALGVLQDWEGDTVVADDGELKGLDEHVSFPLSEAEDRGFDTYPCTLALAYVLNRDGPEELGCDDWDVVDGTACLRGERTLERVD